MYVDFLGDGAGGHAPESNNAEGRGFRTHFKRYLYLVMALLGVLLTGYFAWINLVDYKTFVPFIICSTLLIYLLFLWRRNEKYTSVRPIVKNNTPNAITITESFCCDIWEYHPNSAIPATQKANASLPIISLSIQNNKSPAQIPSERCNISYFARFRIRLKYIYGFLLLFLAFVASIYYIRSTLLT